MAKEAKESVEARVKGITDRNDHKVNELSGRAKSVALTAARLKFDDLEELYRWITRHYADRADEIASRKAREVEDLQKRAADARIPGFTKAQSIKVNEVLAGGAAPEPATAPAATAVVETEAKGQA
mgnify:CR=1 FL=1